VKTAITVIAYNIDRTENVFFDTTVICRKNAFEGEIFVKGIRKLKSMLRRDHPMLLAELVEFHVEAR
jgi:hypothetical protein